ncbi:hypothetical protein PSHT_00939 [Puccinia striiformis]|uniref:Uncharacterized protein n=1 Tax=Puccinia striiformis TaxID=27350 RepID=A0A2S4WLW4_9BASI|nr:hypothetical protein PSHT_00939 [Puccinia striiformis]
MSDHLNVLSNSLKAATPNRESTNEDADLNTLLINSNGNNTPETQAQEPGITANTPVTPDKKPPANPPTVPSDRNQTAEASLLLSDRSSDPPNPLKKPTTPWTATKAGATKKATILWEVYLATNLAPAKTQVTSKKRAREDIEFAAKAVNFHKDVGFPPFFDKNICELRGPIPVTICNKKWQDQGIVYHTDKRHRTEDNNSDKVSRYTSLPYTSEWTTNHWGFYLALEEVYNFPTFASWVLTHKDHCDCTIVKHGFIAALRYDINVRANIFSYRVLRTGDQLFDLPRRHCQGCKLPQDVIEGF